jgi:hypothetical protein
MAKVPVGATIAHAYRFAFGDFLRILGVMWPAMLLMWLPSLLMRQQMMALSLQMAARDYSSLRVLWPLLALFYIGAFILVFMQVIGIAQLALDRHKGPVWLYFSFSKPLWRLIGSVLLLLVALIVGWIAVILCDVLLGFLVKSVLTGASPLTAAVAGLLTIVVVVVTWGALFYSFVRLSFLLTPIVAAEEEGFALGRSWTLGKGNFWRMFAVLLVIWLPFLVLELVFLFGFMFKGVPFPPPHATAAQTAAYQTAINARSMEMMNAMAHNWYIVYPVFIVLIVVLYGSAVGAQCFAYRALTEGNASGPVAAD